MWKPKIESEIELVHSEDGKKSAWFLWIQINGYYHTRKQAQIASLSVKEILAKARKTGG